MINVAQDMNGSAESVSYLLPLVREARGPKCITAKSSCAHRKAQDGGRVSQPAARL